MSHITAHSQTVTAPEGEFRNSDPTPTVLAEVRLDIEEGPKPEGELADFKLSSEIQRLMCQLDQLKEGSRRSKFGGHAVKTGFGPRMARMLDQTISDRLNVTPNEATMLEGLPPATRFKPKDPAPPAPMPSEIQARTIMERRAKITGAIAELGRVPSVREMGKHLIEAGFRGNHQTVFKDYRALGIKSDRTREARAELKSRQLSLPDC